MNIHYLFSRKSQLKFTDFSYVKYKVFNIFCRCLITFFRNLATKYVMHCVDIILVFLVSPPYYLNFFGPFFDG